MATIEKRGSKYRITVSCGADINGKQIRRRMTYTPEPNKTQKQIDKELRRQAILFEEQCQNGLVSDGNIKLCDFAADWFKHKEYELRPKTFARYKEMLPRINAALGHMKLCKIQPQHLLSFYENLSEGNIRLDTKYECKLNLGEYLKEHKLSKAKFARACDLSPSTVSTAIQNRRCSKSTAEGICKGLNMDFSVAFSPVNSSKPLAPKTVLHYHRLISVMLHTAVEWGIIFSNPCDRTKPPKTERTEPKYLDEVQAATLLDLLEFEREDRRVMIRTLLFTGMRRGELLGLKWSDVDFDKGVLHICRSNLYLPDRGIFEDETKNSTSNRFIKLPKTAISDLRKYKAYQMERQLRAGDRWQNTESDYIFTNDEGKPVCPDTLTSWFSTFMKTHSDELPYISLHSLRHTNATLQIAGGVPLTTVAKRMGHADTVTTSKIYAHAIKSADEAAAETLENLLTPTQNRTA